ncbi:MAG: hypothetical protein KAU47_08510, partial [Candidatus Aminicenantes bacterium]|nr:hypothetical protein [Candidatus Aminicenantes bacterium]
SILGHSIYSSFFCQEKPFLSSSKVIAESPANPLPHASPREVQGNHQRKLTAHLTSFDEKKCEKITQQIIHKSD